MHGHLENQQNELPAITILTSHSWFNNQWQKVKIKDIINSQIFVIPLNFDLF
jgi:hypothetical protein